MRFFVFIVFLVLAGLASSAAFDLANQPKVSVYIGSDASVPHASGGASYAFRLAGPAVVGPKGIEAKIQATRSGQAECPGTIKVNTQEQYACNTVCIRLIGYRTQAAIDADSASGQQPLSQEDAIGEHAFMQIGLKSSDGSCNVAPTAADVQALAQSSSKMTPEEQARASQSISGGYHRFLKDVSIDVALLAGIRFKRATPQYLEHPRELTDLMASLHKVEYLVFHAPTFLGVRDTVEQSQLAIRANSVELASSAIASCGAHPAFLEEFSVNGYGPSSLFSVGPSDEWIRSSYKTAASLDEAKQFLSCIGQIKGEKGYFFFDRKIDPKTITRALEDPGYTFLTEYDKSRRQEGNLDVTQADRVVFAYEFGKYLYTQKEDADAINVLSAAILEAERLRIPNVVHPQSGLGLQKDAFDTINAVLARQGREPMATLGGCLNGFLNPLIILKPLQLLKIGAKTGAVMSAGGRVIHLGFALQGGQQLIGAAQTAQESALDSTISGVCGTVMFFGGLKAGLTRAPAASTEMVRTPETGKWVSRPVIGGSKAASARALVLNKELADTPVELVVQRFTKFSSQLKPGESAGEFFVRLTVKGKELTIRVTPENHRAVLADVLHIKATLAMEKADAAQFSPSSIKEFQQALSELSKVDSEKASFYNEFNFQLNELLNAKSKEAKQSIQEKLIGLVFQLSKPENNPAKQRITFLQALPSGKAQTLDGLTPAQPPGTAQPSDRRTLTERLQAATELFKKAKEKFGRSLSRVKQFFSFKDGRRIEVPEEASSQIADAHVAASATGEAQQVVVEVLVNGKKQNMPVFVRPGGKFLSIEEIKQVAKDGKTTIAGVVRLGELVVFDTRPQNLRFLQTIRLNDLLSDSRPLPALRESVTALADAETLSTDPSSAGKSTRPGDAVQLPETRWKDALTRLGLRRNGKYDAYYLVEGAALRNGVPLRFEVTGSDNHVGFLVLKIIRNKIPESIRDATIETLKKEGFTEHSDGTVFSKEVDVRGQQVLLVPKPGATGLATPILDTVAPEFQALIKELLPNEGRAQRVATVEEAEALLGEKGLLADPTAKTQEGGNPFDPGKLIEDQAAKAEPNAREVAEEQRRLAEEQSKVEPVRAPVQTQDGVWEVSEGRGLTVGRLTANRVVLPSESIARRQGTFSADSKDGVFYVNTGSTSGYRVIRGRNEQEYPGSHTEPVSLKAGDSVVFADGSRVVVDSYSPKSGSGPAVARFRVEPAETSTSPTLETLPRTKGGSYSITGCAVCLTQNPLARDFLVDEGQKASVGRQEGNTIMFENAHVSREQGRFDVGALGVTYTNLGRSNFFAAVIGGRRHDFPPTHGEPILLGPFDSILYLNGEKIVGSITVQEFAKAASTGSSRLLLRVERAGFTSTPETEGGPAVTPEKAEANREAFEKPPARASGAKPKLEVKKAGVAEQAKVGETVSQDSLLSIEQGDRSVDVVADGVGGALGGRVASQAFVNGINTRFPEMTDQLSLEEAFNGAAGDTVSALRPVLEANKFDRETGEPLNPQGGTTALVLLINGRKAHLAGIGDGALFMIRGGNIELLSEIHNDAYGARGQVAGLRPEDAFVDRTEAGVNTMRNSITRSIDAGIYDGEFESSQGIPRGQHFSREFSVQDGDRFILVSDGVADVVTPTEIREIGRRGTPEQAAQAILALARQRISGRHEGNFEGRKIPIDGKNDDISVIVRDVGERPASEESSSEPSRSEPAVARSAPPASMDLEPFTRLMPAGPTYSIRIGRDAVNDVVLPNDFVSRYQGVLHSDSSGRLFYENEGGSNSFWLGRGGSLTELSGRRTIELRVLDSIFFADGSRVYFRHLNPAYPGSLPSAVFDFFPKSVDAPEFQPT